MRNNRSVFLTGQRVEQNLAAGIFDQKAHIPLFAYRSNEQRLYSTIIDNASTSSFDQHDRPLAIPPMPFATRPRFCFNVFSILRLLSVSEEIDH